MGARVVSKPLATERLPDGRRRLLRELVVEIDGSIIRVPKGFISDFSSFPWFMRWFVRWSKVDVAGVVHDWLYRGGKVSRKIADMLWRKVAVSGQHSANAVQGWISYAGLRTFGWMHYNK